jgi:hypothetical protein
VVDPNGVEIWAKHQNSAMPPKPGQPPNPDWYKMGGVLDFDSNSMCMIDGRRRENAVWMTPPPVGHYLVRVDTFSLCGAPIAHWVVNASLDGQTLALASGVGLDSDAAYSHDQGAGVLAAQFDVPSH